MTPAPIEPCMARVEDPAGFGSYACSFRGKHVTGGIHLCGTHMRSAQKWAEEGQLIAMAHFWWYLKITRADATLFYGEAS